MSYISLFVTLSRPEYIQLVFDNINKITLNQDHLYELVIGIDNIKIKDTHLVKYINEYPFQNITIFETGNKPPRKTDMVARRTRIAKLHELAKDHIGGSDFVFGFEDDSVLPLMALGYLHDDYRELDNVGVVQGIQVGRWGNPYLGAWLVDDVFNPTEYRTTTFDFSYGADEKQTVYPIDAGGFYCYLTPTKLFKNVINDWREPCGPDVNYGLRLRQLGYQNYVDYFVEVGHRTEREELWPDNNLAQITFKLENGRWRSKIVRSERINVKR